MDRPVCNLVFKYCHNHIVYIVPRKSSVQSTERSGCVKPNKLFPFSTFYFIEYLWSLARPAGNLLFPDHETLMILLLSRLYFTNLPKYFFFYFFHTNIIILFTHTRPYFSFLIKMYIFRAHETFMNLLLSRLYLINVPNSFFNFSIYIWLCCILNHVYISILIK